MDFRRLELGVADGETLKPPRVSVEALRRPHNRWFLFLDEFEKARPTEFAAEQLFGLLDAAMSFKHQLIITSNLKTDELRQHWSRASEVYGTSIMTRVQMCILIDFS
jgi:DNA replication protein DnaC